MCYGKNLYYKKLWIAYNNFTLGQKKGKNALELQHGYIFRVSKSTSLQFLTLSQNKSHFTST